MVHFCFFFFGTEHGTAGQNFVIDKNFLEPHFTLLSELLIIRSCEYVVIGAFVHKIIRFFNNIVIVCHLDAHNNLSFMLATMSNRLEHSS